MAGRQIEERWERGSGDRVQRGLGGAVVAVGCWVVLPLLRGQSNGG